MYQSYTQMQPKQHMGETQLGIQAQVMPHLSVNGVMTSRSFVPRNSYLTNSTTQPTNQLSNQ